MDDYSIESLMESRNEWSARLVSTVVPLIVGGFNSIFDEADNLCMENDEEDKVLMTFQNLISRIPKWSNAIVATETARIKEDSHCDYLEELITCVHIIHLKALTVVRVGQKQRRIDIDVPSLEKFIHDTYTCCARTIYRNVYLFDKNVAPLTFQKQARELDVIVREGVLEAIRASIPIDKILKAYIEKTEEEEIVEKPVAPEIAVMDPDEEQNFAITRLPETPMVAAPLTIEPMVADISTATSRPPLTDAEKVSFTSHVQTQSIDGSIGTERTLESMTAPAVSVVSNVGYGDSHDLLKIESTGNPISLDIEDLTPVKNNDQVSIGDIELL